MLMTLDPDGQRRGTTFVRFYLNFDLTINFDNAFAYTLIYF